MSAALSNDGLLKAVRIIVTILMAILGVGFAGLAIAMPIIFFSQSHLAEAMVADAPGSLAVALSTIIAVLALGMVLIALAFHFLQLLKRIVGSVGEGDPFIADNADRLSRMAWIAIAIEVLKLPLGALALYLVQFFESDAMKIDAQFSLTGILLALILFILARVFRHGAALRADLEGTV